MRREGGQDEDDQPEACRGEDDAGAISVRTIWVEKRDVIDDKTSVCSPREARTPRGKFGKVRRANGRAGVVGQSAKKG